jgi:hypothetical protein
MFPSETSTPSHQSMAPVLFAQSRPAMNCQKMTTSKRSETLKDTAIAESCGIKHSAQEVTSVIYKTACLWADPSKYAMTSSLDSIGLATFSLTRFRNIMVNLFLSTTGATT